MSRIQLALPTIAMLLIAVPASAQSLRQSGIAVVLSAPPVPESGSLVAAGIPMEGTAAPAVLWIDPAVGLGVGFRF